MRQHNGFLVDRTLYNAKNVEQNMKITAGNIKQITEALAKANLISDIDAAIEVMENLELESDVIAGTGGGGTLPIMDALRAHGRGSGGGISLTTTKSDR